MKPDQLLDFPYLFYGQFNNEIAQKELAQSFLKNIESSHYTFHENNRSFIVLKYLEWDTFFFGYTVYSIESLRIDNPDDTEDMVKFLKSFVKQNEIKYLFVRININQQKEINFLLSLEFFFLNSKYLLKRKLKIRDFNDQEYANEINLEIKDYEPRFKRELVQIGKQNFINNRFYLDPTISNDQASEIYTSWLNSEIQSAPEDIKLAFSQKMLVGFSIVSKVEKPVPLNSYFVKLIAVHSEHRGEGIAQRLLQENFSFANRDNFNILYANVVSTNISSYKMFQKVEFLLEDSLLEFRKIYI